MVVAFPPQNHFAWKLSVTLLHAVAFSSGIARLVSRAKRRLWWWDDTILIVPLLVEPLSVAFLWLRYPGNTGLIPNSSLPRHVVVLHSFWATNLPFALIIWPCRIVLALSMARALPPQHRARTWSFATAIMMALCGVMTLLVSYFTCRSSPLLDRKDPRFCSKVGKMPTGVFIGVLIDLFADTFLVVFAFTLFRSIPLPRFEKNLVLLVFSGSILTVLSVLVWVFLIYGPFNHGADTVMMAGMLRNFETSLSLLSCNLFIFSTAIIRLRKWLVRRSPGSFKVAESNPSNMTSDSFIFRHDTKPSTCLALTGHSEVTVSPTATSLSA